MLLIMLRRVHASGHPRKGLMLRLLRDAKPFPNCSQVPEKFTVRVVI